MESGDRPRLLDLNLAQYAAIGLIVFLLGNAPHQTWLIPLTMAVVGLHFLPLARLFNSPPHAWIGLAMLVVAGVVALLHLPPFDPIGIFAGGAVLLGGALLLATEARRSSA